MPVPALAADLRARSPALFDRHGYADARDLRARQGRQHPLHAHRPVRRRRAAATAIAGFTEDMVDLVLGHGGSLKAEHGTGRVMAPFVRRQYGDELYDGDARDQAAVRPARRAQPGRVLNDDPTAHLRAPQARADRRGRGRPLRRVRLLRAGLPEPRPHRSRRGSGSCCAASMRARRAGRRRRARRGARATTTTTTGVDTCAVDGMCQTACPVLINTGDLVKRLRSERPAAGRGGGLDGGREALGRGAPGAASVALTVAARAARRRWSAGRRGAGPQVVGPDTRAAVVAGPARRRAAPRAARPGRRRTRCTCSRRAPARCSGPADGAGRARRRSRSCASGPGSRCRCPTGSPSLCCGTPWKSKGLRGGYEAMAARVLPALLGRHPGRAAAGGRATRRRAPRACGRCWRRRPSRTPGSGWSTPWRSPPSTLLPRLGRHATGCDSVALHPTCSSTQLGLDAALRPGRRGGRRRRHRARTTGAAARSPATAGCCTPS